MLETGSNPNDVIKMLPVLFHIRFVFIFIIYSLVWTRTNIYIYIYRDEHICINMYNIEHLYLCTVYVM